MGALPNSRLEYQELSCAHRGTPIEFATMTPNPFDQGGRYAAKLNPPGFYSWLLSAPIFPLAFHSWLDTRSIPFPGDPDRICDEKDAASTLAGIGNGTIARCILPFIPLMQGGGKAATIKHWKELAQAESDTGLRADYAGLALVFAELTKCRPAWKSALEGWDVIQSQQVLEWQEQARVETKAEALLTVLRIRLSRSLPANLERAIQATSDLALLDRWLENASTASSITEFQRLAGLKTRNGSRRRGSNANGTSGGRKK